VSAAAATIVRAQAVVKQYRRGHEIVCALRGVDFTQRAGELIMLTGESGSGKSTLLNLFGCLDTPTSGRIELFDLDAAAQTDRQRTRLRKEKIGFIFQDFHLIPVLSAVENVAYALELRGLPGGRRRAAETLVRVGLADRLNAQVNTLSGGQMQRVAVARALVGGPSLVLADEPTANLDTHNKDQVMRLLTTLCREEGAAVLLVTHDLNLSRWVDRVVHLHDGRIALN
jgi:putative ABC transport system ATP-binding protein